MWMMSLAFDPTVDVDAHVAAFNKAVQDGDWEPYLDRFTEEAVLEFVGPPVGPLVGRGAIAQAYADNPPDDTIEVIAPAIDARRHDCGAVSMAAHRRNRLDAHDER